MDKELVRGLDVVAKLLDSSDIVIGDDSDVGLYSSVVDILEVSDVVIRGDADIDGDISSSVDEEFSEFIDELDVNMVKDGESDSELEMSDDIVDMLELLTIEEYDGSDDVSLEVEFDTVNKKSI